jgi:hypothetical protein
VLGGWLIGCASGFTGVATLDGVITGTFDGGDGFAGGTGTFEGAGTYVGGSGVVVAPGDGAAFGRMLGGCGRMLGGSGRALGGPDGSGRARTGGGGGPPDGVVSGAASLGRCRTGGGGGPPERGGGLPSVAATKNGCAGVMRSATKASSAVADGFGRGGENAGRGGE